jgi:hypothetical protein
MNNPETTQDEDKYNNKTQNSKLTSNTDTIKHEC